MRQAGRYLPEYRALRAEAGGFLDLVYNPKLAAEVTLQPIRRFDFDAAILFSDILVIPQALGRDLRFERGEGPRLDPLSEEKDFDALDMGQVSVKLAPVFETISLVRKALPQEKALIGFCGGPWTVATYMIAGRGKDEQEAAKKLCYGKPKLFLKLIDRLVEASIAYLKGQLKAGADCLQIFESWAGALDVKAFHEFVIAPTKRITDAVKQEYPHAKIIGFPRGCGALLSEFARDSGVDAVGIDWQQDLRSCVREINLPIQGNLDPIRLLGSHDQLENILLEMKNAVIGRPYIFNLGHGILPSTPIETVDFLVKFIRTS